MSEKIGHDMVKVRIGIDPDIEKSGYAEIRNKQVVILDNLDLFDLTTCLSAMFHEYGTSLMVHIEAGWLNKKTMFHFTKDKNNRKVEYGKSVTAKISMSTGQNHAIGKLIEQYCVKNFIPYRLFKPTGKKWDAKLFKQITGYEGRTNPEMRDAVRAAWR